MGLIQITNGKSGKLANCQLKEVKIYELIDNNLTCVITRLLETNVPSEFRTIIEDELFFQPISVKTDRDILNYITKLNNIDDIHNKFETRFKKYAAEYGFNLTMDKILRG